MNTTPQGEAQTIGTWHAPGAVLRLCDSARFWAANALVASSYALLGFGVSRVFAQQALFPAPSWPSASIAIAAALLGGWRYAPGIFIGSVVVNQWLYGPPAVLTLGVSVTNVVGPVAAAAVLRGATDARLPFDRLHDVMRFLAYGVGLHAAITATGGTAATWSAELHGVREVPVLWLRWFLSDAGGVLFFGPTVLLWWCRPGLPGKGGSRVAFAMLTGALVLLSACIFFDLILPTAGLIGLPCILVPFLLWGALRFSPREAAIWLSLIAIVATAGTVHGTGPFGPDSEFPGMASIGLMLLAFAMSVLPASALVQERRAANRALHDANRALEARVAERTGELERELVQRRETERLVAILRQALDDSHMLFFLIDSAGCVHYMNNRAVEVTGQQLVPGAPLTVHDVWPALSERDWGGHWSRIRRGETAPYETELRAGTGELMHVEVTPHYTRIDGTEYDLAVVQDITDRKRVREELAHRAAHDPLTGVFNRRAWFQRAHEEVARARRHGRSLAVLMLDLDHFKPVNDTHGHDAGDRVLCAFSTVCRTVMRDNDILARFGGEEFIVLAPDTDRSAALALAERLRATVAAARFGDGVQVPVTLTLSIGVAAWAPGDATIEPAIARADQQLYVAKRAGRNRVSG